MSGATRAGGGGTWAAGWGGPGHSLTPGAAAVGPHVAKGHRLAEPWRGRSGTTGGSARGGGLRRGGRRAGDLRVGRGRRKALWVFSGRWRRCAHTAVTAAQACEYATRQRAASRVACGVQLHETVVRKTARVRKGRARGRRERAEFVARPSLRSSFRLRVASTSRGPAACLPLVTRPARGGPGPMSASPIPRRGRRPPRQPRGVTQAQGARATKRPAGCALGE